jgi:hypothetical protein
MKKMVNVTIIIIHVVAVECASLVAVVILVSALHDAYNNKDTM